MNRTRLARNLLWLAALSCLLAGPARAQEGCLECHGLAGLALPGRPLWLGAPGHASDVHGRLPCTDCHKGVEGYPHASPQVRCDLPCHVAGANHEALVRAEAGSVHARPGLPSCGGCHDAGRAPRGAAAAALCRSCHAGLEPPRRFFGDSPGAFGFFAHRRVPAGRRAPGCPDCHGTHGVGPAEKARATCAAAGCHPGTGPEFARLFDHRPAVPGRPWGGAGPAALGLGGLVAAVLLLHATRRP